LPGRRSADFDPRRGHQHQQLQQQQQRRRRALLQSPDVVQLLGVPPEERPEWRAAPAPITPPSGGRPPQSGTAGAPRPAAMRNSTPEWQLRPTWASKWAAQLAARRGFDINAVAPPPQAPPAVAPAPAPAVVRPLSGCGDSLMEAEMLLRQY